MLKYSTVDTTDLIRYWVQEVSIALHLEFEHSVTFNGRIQSVIPKCSAYSAISEILQALKSNKEVSCIKIFGPDGVEVQFRSSSSTSEEYVTFNMFEGLESMGVSNVYSKFVNVESSEIFMDNGSAFSKCRNYGAIHKAHPNTERITIITPIYKRTDLTRLYVKYTTEYLAPALRWFGFDVAILICGGVEDFESVRHSISDFSNVMYLEHVNILGEKKNRLLKTAHSLNSHFVLLIDSDDFFHPETCLELINKARVNTYWSSIKEFVFVNAQDKVFGKFLGYKKGHALEGWGMGSGRVFTSKLLDSFQESPFAPLNKSMDFYIKEHLSALNVQASERLLDTSRFLPLGLKTQENIWAFGKYALESLDDKRADVSWLPFSIKDSFLKIPFEI